MYGNFDFRGLFYFAVVGMVLSAGLALAGAVWLIWFFINHVRFV